MAPPGPRADSQTRRPRHASIRRTPRAFYESFGALSVMHVIRQKSKYPQPQKHKMLIEANSSRTGCMSPTKPVVIVYETNGGDDIRRYHRRVLEQRNDTNAIRGLELVPSAGNMCGGKRMPSMLRNTALAVALGVAAWGRPADAAFIFTAVEQASDVVFTG